MFDLNNRSSMVSDPDSNTDSWIIHFFAKDLQILFTQDWPKVRSRCLAEEETQIRTAFDRIRRFCLFEEALPVNETQNNLRSGATAGGQLLDQIDSFTKDLNTEWLKLSGEEKIQMRRALSETFERRNSGSRESIRWGEFVVVITALICWISLFAIGYTVHAGPYEDVIKEPGPGGRGLSEMIAFAGALVMFIVASIPTNVMLLVCIASTLGVAYRRATMTEQQLAGMNAPRDYVFGVAASFFMYIVLIGGLLTLSVADILTNESQEKHLKLAGTASMLAFLVGYDREFIAWLLRLAAAFVTHDKQPSDNDDAGTRGRRPKIPEDPSGPKPGGAQTFGSTSPGIDHVSVPAATVVETAASGP